MKLKNNNSDSKKLNPKKIFKLIGSAILASSISFGSVSAQNNTTYKSPTSFEVSEQENPEIGPNDAVMQISEGIRLLGTDGNEIILDPGEIFIPNIHFLININGESTHSVVNLAQMQEDKRDRYEFIEPIEMLTVEAGINELEPDLQFNFGMQAGSSILLQLNNEGGLNMSFEIISENENGDLNVVTPERFISTNSSVESVRSYFDPETNFLNIVALEDIRLILVIGTNPNLIINSEG